MGGDWSFDIEKKLKDEQHRARISEPNMREVKLLRLRDRLWACWRILHDRNASYWWTE